MTASRPSLPPTLVALAVPVPPMLEEAVGYPGDAAFLALYWTPLGDEVIYEDGVRSGTGAWAPFLAFKRHPAVAPVLAPYDLGSSDAEARDWLLLDRRARRLYVGPRADVAAVLRAQAGRPQDDEPATPLSAELVAELATLPFAEVRIDPAALATRVDERMRRERELVAALVGWLNQAAGGTTRG